MPCSDSSSSMVIRLDIHERFASFEYAKITCNQEIKGEGKSLSQYLQGKILEDILKIPFEQIHDDLNLKDKESQFILYMQWDALMAAIALYLGIESGPIDTDRCMITSIEHTPEGIEIAEVVLPPKEIPKIIPCSLKMPRQF